MSTHADRPVTIQTDAHGLKVVKKRFLQANGSRIFAEHRALWQSPFGARRLSPGLPQPLRWDPTAQTVTMEFVTGAAVGQRGDLGTTADVSTTAAHLLADFHTSGVVVQRIRGAASILRSISRKAVEMDATPLGPSFRHLLQALIHRAPVHEQCVVSHGDFSPRNVLQDGQRLTLIDFDRLQMASPTRDLAYWGAWAWATQRLAGQPPSWQIGNAILDAYLEYLPASAQFASEMNFHRGASFARIVHGWSAFQGHPDIAEMVLRDALCIE